MDTPVDEFDVILTEAFRTFDGISWVNIVEQRRTWIDNVELVNPGISEIFCW